MKKAILLLLFISTLSVYSQGNPNPFPRGVHTKFMRLDTLSTAQRTSLTPKLGDIIYHKDTGISRHEKFNGATWEELGGSVDESAAYTWTGAHNFNSLINVNGSNPYLSVNNTSNFRSAALWSDSMIFSRDANNLTIGTPTLTANTTINYPNKAAGTYTFATLSDIVGGGLPLGGTVGQIIKNTAPGVGTWQDFSLPEGFTTTGTGTSLINKIGSINVGITVNNNDSDPVLTGRTITFNAANGGYVVNPSNYGFKFKTSEGYYLGFGFGNSASNLTANRNVVFQDKDYTGVADISDLLIIQHNGTTQTARANLNFTGDGVVVDDNAGNNSTDINIAINGGLSPNNTQEKFTAVGAETTWVLSNTPSVNTTNQLFIGGVLQEYGVGYSLSGNTITFLGINSPLVAADKVEYHYNIIGTGNGFIENPDTPSTYTGQAGKFVKVNVGEDALEFTDAPTTTHPNYPVYADNAAALAGGLVENDVYKTSLGAMYQVYPNSAYSSIFFGDLHDDYANLGAVASEILSRNPNYLINAGDIYPNGSVADFTSTLTPYQTLIDAEKYYHVKGDHELNTATAIGDLTVGTTIFSKTDSWSYLESANGAAYPTDWKLDSFDDSGWSTGSGSFGFGSITGVTIATSLTTGRLNYLFRKTVNSSAVTGDGIVMEVSGDDGFEVYINGNMIYSFNMVYPVTQFTTTHIATGTNTNDGHQYLEGYNQVVRIPSSLIQAGDNQIAVVLKNYEAGSSDVHFEMSMKNYAFANGDTFYANGYGDGLNDFLPYLPNYGEQYSIIDGNAEYFFLTSGRQDSSERIASPSWQGANSQQADWLEDALSTSTAQFKIVVTHDTPVTTVTAYNRTYFDYLLNNVNYPIDLMLVGDTHVSECFTHTSGLVVANASNHDTSSRPDVGIQATTPGDWTEDYHNNTNGENYFLQVSNTATTLTLEWIDKDGVVQFTKNITN